MIKSNSHLLQDIFVLSLFKKDYKGIFIDIGCQLPEQINNTLLLEENGWTGISLDVIDYSNEWKIRKTPFIKVDALDCDYNLLFEKYNIPKVIDYLSVDIEGDGLRYLALKHIIEFKCEFKVITIEHDSYRGYNLSEREPQRMLLTNMEYFLLCDNVLDGLGNQIEDWWINPKYFNQSEYMFYSCSNTQYFNILNKK